MTKALVLKALIQAYLRQHPSGSVLHHSDRGSQYPSREYQVCLQVLDIPFFILKGEDQTHVEAEKVSMRSRTLHARLRDMSSLEIYSKFVKEDVQKKDMSSYKRK